MLQISERVRIPSFSCERLIDHIKLEKYWSVTYSLKYNHLAELVNDINYEDEFLS